ncbi:MAG: alpha-mannosidase [Calditrichaeota bacterium]|nr:alpha-mannosidase [Calditrichota bacterium]
MMIRLLILTLFFSFIPVRSPAQNHQSALQILNFLAYGGMAQLKYKVGGEPGGEDPNLDDSGWETKYIGYKWDLPETNVWFRTTFVVPERIGGFSMAGRTLTLHLNVDNGGDVYVNGKYLGSFTWANGHFVIAKNIQPGQRYVVAIRGINHPGFGQLKAARMDISGMEDFQKKIRGEVWKLFAAKKIAREFSANPDYWYKQVDLVAERAFQSKAFQKGDQDGFIRALDREMEALRPLGDQVRKKYHIYAAGYAHMDLAWMWTWRESIEVVHHTTQSVLNIMKKFPDFKYSMSSAAAYVWLEKYYPNLFRQVQEKVKEGRWEVMGGMWVEPDCNLPSGESFVRQVLYAKRYFQKKLGVDVKICWIPDSFGYNWNLPQILARSGFEGFITHKINWNDTNKFPYRFFWWEAPDGSKIMSYIPESGYGHNLVGDDLIEFAQHERQDLGLGKVFVIYGVGNHGGGPTMKMLENAENEIHAPAFLDVKLVRSDEFFDSITPQEKAKLPTWDSELYLEFHRGTYTSQAKTKKHNRKVGGLAVTAEKTAALASLCGEPYPAGDFAHIWHTILFNQFHDILPGSSINEVYRDADREYEEAWKLEKDIVDRSLQVLAQHIDTRGKGEALVVFNPESWVRTSVATVSLGRLEKERTWHVLDENAHVVASQVVEKSPLGAKLIFIARNVPSLGYKIYRLEEGAARAPQTDIRADSLHLQNGLLSLALDRKTGLIRSLKDVVNQREVLAEPRGNLLQLRTVEPNDAWNLRFKGPWIDLDSAWVVERVEAGPVRATIHVKHSFLGPQKSEASPTEGFPSSFFDQYISLYAGQPYVEVRNHIEWWEKHKMLKVAFPVAVHAKKATYEIPYATIERSTGNRTSFEKARFEVPAQRWADLSQTDYGVSLINESKYGYDIKGNLMRLSLLRSPTAPDPMADRGYQDFSYLLYPHTGSWREAGTARLAVEYNRPLIVFRAKPHRGNLPKEKSFVQVTPENVFLNVVKKAEDSTCWILRLVEMYGKTARVTVHLDQKIVSVQETDLLERKLRALRPEGNGFRFEIKPHEIRTFRVCF